MQGMLATRVVTAVYVVVAESAVITVIDSSRARDGEGNCDDGYLMDVSKVSRNRI